MHLLPRAIVALIRRSDGRHLLIRRADRVPGGGYWCPVSGRPLTDEALPDTVAREVIEEVGLRVNVGEIVHRCPTDDGRYQLIWFTCRPAVPEATAPPLRLDPDEVAEAGWFLPEEAVRLEPMFEATRDYFRTLIGEFHPT